MDAIFGTFPSVTLFVVRAKAVVTGRGSWVKLIGSWTNYSDSQMSHDCFA